VFTDQPVTPARIEVLIDLLRNMGNRKYDQQTLYDVLQPEGIPKLNPKKGQAKETVSAARALDLLTEEEGRIRLKRSHSERLTATEILLSAIDDRILSSTDVEPYFALFYSYLLAANKKGAAYRLPKEWATDFNRDVYGNNLPKNKFNEDKYSGLRPWMSYAGLGWYDSEEVFQPNPYERLRRRLTKIFSGSDSLEGDKFMERLSNECPELDGGDIFRRANPKYSHSHKTCSLGLSHALIDLHSDGVIRLLCPRDSHGWSIELADPPLDNRYIRSERIDHVEIRKKQ
jgi:hypothetical protein